LLTSKAKPKVTDQEVV